MRGSNFSQTNGRVRCVPPCISVDKQLPVPQLAAACATVPHPNHNREVFSKGDAKYEKRYFHNELNSFMRGIFLRLLFFLQAEQKNPPRKMDFKLSFSRNCD